MKLVKHLALVALVLTLMGNATAQKRTSKTAVSKETIAKSVTPKKPGDEAVDEKKVRDMVAFLEYMLNTLGSSGTPTRDKEVLITESYSKIFRDSKVQIEDDLDEDRVVITNKDIVAYLKDVNFFFTNARFEFTIEHIEKSPLPTGELFYKVSAKRNLTATTIGKKPINNSLPRYIEINYNPKEDDLKIVSIYTSGIDEKRALTGWWNELSFEWQTIFRRKFNLQDSVSLKEIKAITAIDTLDLSGNKYIQNIEPLSQLSALRTLDLSGTNIVELSAMRNLTELRDLNLSRTKIRDLTPLKYSNKLARLNISRANVTSLSVLEKMPELRSLELIKTPISDFSPIGKLSELQSLNLSSTVLPSLASLAHLTKLKELKVSGTPIQNLSPLESLSTITAINLDSTKVNDLAPLGNLKNLSVLSVNFTLVSNLMPLRNLTSLEKIYCDQTGIKREAADAFMAGNPNALVIFDSNDLKNWWAALKPEWRDVLQGAAGIGVTATKEELAQIPLLDSINISGRSKIRDLDPLAKLPKLKVLVASKTNISSLAGVQQNREIVYMDISETKVNDISAIAELKKLKFFRANNTPIEKIEQESLSSLQMCYVDNTPVSDQAAREFLEKNPGCLLVYKTDRLQDWWDHLSTEWKAIFQSQMGIQSKITTEKLHALIEKESIEIKDAAITNLWGIKEFIRLKKISVSGTAMSSISPLSKFTSLKTLQVSGAPLREIDSVFVLKDLVELDLSNTPLEDIYPVWQLKNLRSLNCSGTQIKRLDVLEKLENLEHLDCSNTNVTKLNSLDYLPLKTLKCYNTKVSNRAIENFKTSHPDCKVMYYR